MNQPAHPNQGGYGGYPQAQPQPQYQNAGYAPQPYQSNQPQQYGGQPNQPQQYGGQPAYNQGYPQANYQQQAGNNYPTVPPQQGAKPAPPPQHEQKKGFFGKIKGLFN